MAKENRFLASLEMTAKQIERKSVKLLRLCRRSLTPPVSHALRVMSTEGRHLETSFIPHFTNKTTSVARECPTIRQPHYLIKKNEVMRSIIQGNPSVATVVVQSFELAKNEVIVNC